MSFDENQMLHISFVGVQDTLLQLIPSNVIYVCLSRLVHGCDDPFDAKVINPFF